LARGALPSAFATITKIIPPAFRRHTTHPAEQSSEFKVVLGDYYGALGATGLFGPSRSRPWPVERAVAEGYERIIWVFRSVQTITGQSSRLPFRLKQGDQVLDDHPLYWVLNKQANPMETGRQFRTRLLAQVLLSKRGAFVQITRARNGDICRLDLLPPGRTRPVPGIPRPGIPAELIDHYEVLRADGSRAFIPAEEVTWFREPHPTDPYSGVTPLEAAGMSVELDFFARLYNLTFMKNDGRPGGIIGITGDMDEKEMKKLEETFGRGPAEAGKLTVIAGEVSYVDSVVRPRDAQYGTMATNSKIEILDAFGIAETMMGNSAGRTFDNAGQDGLNFWQITMPPHLDMLVTGFDGMSDPDLEGFFDVSSVPALAAAEAAKRAEARGEFGQGLISVDDYRIATGKEPYDLPATRALILTGGTTLVPTSAADQKALGGALIPLGQGAASAQSPGGPPAPPSAAATGARPRSAIPAPRNAGNGAGAGPGGDGETGDDPDGDADGDGNGDAAETTEGPQTKSAPVIRLPSRSAAPGARRLIAACQVKAIPNTAAPPSQPGSGTRQDDSEDASGPAQQQQLEAALSAALTALAATWTARTAARLSSPKTRKGTRHWQPDPQMPADTRAGTQPLDPTDAADPARWQIEAEDTARPLLTAAAIAAAAGLAAHLAPGTPTSAISDAAGSAVGTVLAMIGAAAAGLADKTAMAIATADDAGQHMDEITAQARDVMDREGATWAAGVAVQAATAVISAARDLIATMISALDPSKYIVRTWRTRRDLRVREAHRLAEGQRQPPGMPFIVGGVPLRYPGDPAGPPELTYNCRCHVTHRLGRIGNAYAQSA
jgi:HK97 family phage portal protein